MQRTEDYTYFSCYSRQLPTFKIPKTGNMKFAIFGNSHQTKKCDRIAKLFDTLDKKGDNYAIERKFYDFLMKMGIEQAKKAEIIENDDFEADMVISYGGDGTLLKTACKVGSKGYPIIGVNAGRLGFLTTTSSENIEAIIESIHCDNFNIEERSIIEVTTESGSLKNYPYALNEIAIMKHDSSSMITIETTLNDCETIVYQADGLIVAAPSGSTGYSLSVGGPIIAPDAHVMVLTPIAPHSLNVRPFVVNDNTEVKIKVHSRSHNFLIAIDGRNESFEEGTTLTIRKASYKQRIVRIKDDNFIKNLREKMMWGVDARE